MENDFKEIRRNCYNSNEEENGAYYCTMLENERKLLNNCLPELCPILTKGVQPIDNLTELKKLVILQGKMIVKLQKDVKEIIGE